MNINYWQTFNMKRKKTWLYLLGPQVKNQLRHEEDDFKKDRTDDEDDTFNAFQIYWWLIEKYALPEKNVQNTKLKKFLSWYVKKGNIEASHYKFKEFLGDLKEKPSENTIWLTFDTGIRNEPKFKKEYEKYIEKCEEKEGRINILLV